LPVAARRWVLIDNRCPVATGCISAFVTETDAIASDKSTKETTPSYIKQREDYL
jgi:hypothetical protein